MGTRSSSNQAPPQLLYKQEKKKNLKMKTFAAIGALLFLAAAANAYSINQLRSLIMEEMNQEKKSENNIITLREYLDNLEKPDEWYREAPVHKRSMEKRQSGAAGGGAQDCRTVCGHPPTLDESATCSSEKFAPDYVLNGNCECLTGYRCCPDTCPAVDKEICWANNQKGFSYGEIELDCCGCNIVKCLPCDAPETEDQACPRGQNAKPANCYAYTQNYAFRNDEHQCYRAHCEPKPSDAPQNEVCDANCRSPVPRTSACLFSYTVCEPTIFITDCPRRQQSIATNALTKPLECYGPPTEVDDPNGGYYNPPDSNTCKKCTMWTYAEKPCEQKNALANNADCHQYGANEMDRKCFTKRMTSDNCGCSTYECELAGPVEPETFLPTEVCPKDHVKIVGTTICMRERHICKQCPALITMTASDCPIGIIRTVQDCNGCTITKCQKPYIAPCGACGENEVAKWTYDNVGNFMNCNCEPAVIPQ